MATHPHRPRPSGGIRLLVLLLLLGTGWRVTAQRPLGIAYYDADRLYDTLPALFYDDSEFTPEGELRWNTSRYERKIRQTAALLDSMRMDLVVITGVENEAVVRDLVTACREEYCYIHRTFNTFDGLDIALLYHGDRFFPECTEQGRGWLYVEGTLRERDSTGNPRRLGILACNNARYATEALNDCRDRHPATPLLVAGRLSPQSAARHGLHHLTAEAERVGYGNIHYRDGWKLRDRLFASPELPIETGRIYVRRFLFDTRRGGPLPTYEKGVYLGGTGRLLPIYTYLWDNYLER